MYSGIRNDECLICNDSLFKGADLYSLIIDDQICFMCRDKLLNKLKIGYFENYRLFSFYTYNEDFSKLLIRYKDLLDKPLAPVFLAKWLWLINSFFKGYKIVLIPSSKKLIEHRGFNHLQLMLNGVKLPILDILEKTNSIQRFEKNRDKLAFKLKDDSVKLDKVVIFDDVITSGSSIRAAIKILAPIANKIVIVSIATNIK